MRASLSKAEGKMLHCFDVVLKMINHYKSQKNKTKKSLQGKEKGVIYATPTRRSRSER